MKRLSTIMMCLFAMMAASWSAKAQEVTITLNPGWTWISYPRADTLEITTVLGVLPPMEGDYIKSQYNFATYYEGEWIGNAQHFCPGLGYMYYSNRTEPVSLNIQVQQPDSQVFVTTSEPADITTSSAVTGGTVTINEGNHVYARGVCWDTMPMPTVGDNHTSDGTGTGAFTTTLMGLTASTTYYVRAYVVTDYGLAYGEEVTFTTLDDGGIDYEYVDLGLPSGTLWATCNVGAETPEAYGDYFAWGETQPKDTYNWSTYQYCMGSGTTLTKYCNNSNYGYNGFTDNLTVLLPEDDAATANWGSDWRMPTKEEFQELYNNTTVIWTQQNGVNGRLFTANNGNSLFLPAAGYHQGSGLYDVGNGGDYWSSSLYTDYPLVAWRFFFGSSNYGMSNQGHRLFGYPVRAVRSSQN